MEETDGIRAVLKPGIVEKKKRIALVKWLVGGVARHKRCQCGLEMSRTHSIACSGAGELLMHRFGQEINRASPLNWISQLLNVYRNSPDGQVYNVLYDAIKMIYENCLGYRQQANGFFAANIDGAEEDAAEALRGFQRPEQYRYQPMIPARRRQEFQGGRAADFNGWQPP